MVGRAVTAIYAPYPTRLCAGHVCHGQGTGLSGTPNQWVIDHLQSRDIIVADMYDKVYKGTFLGGNLTTALHNKNGQRRRCDLGAVSVTLSNEQGTAGTGILPRYRSYPHS